MRAPISDLISTLCALDKEVIPSHKSFPTSALLSPSGIFCFSWDWVSQQLPSTFIFSSGSFPQLTNISLVQKKVSPALCLPFWAIIVFLSSMAQFVPPSCFLFTGRQTGNAVRFPSQPPWCLINCQIAGPVLALIQSFLQDASLLRETLFCLDLPLPFTPCLLMAP